VLGASASLTGAQARAVVAALAAARPGPVPDNPQACTAGPEESPVWLHLHYQDRSQQTLRVRFGGCQARWVAGSTGVSQVTVALLQAAIGPLHSGFGFEADLPRR